MYCQNQLFNNKVINNTHYFKGEFHLKVRYTILFVVNGLYAPSTLVKINNNGNSKHIKMVKEEIGLQFIIL